MGWTKKKIGKINRPSCGPPFWIVQGWNPEQAGPRTASPPAFNCRRRRLRLGYRILQTDDDPDVARIRMSLAPYLILTPYPCSQLIWRRSAWDWRAALIWDANLLSALMSNGWVDSDSVLHSDVSNWAFPVSAAIAGCVMTASAYKSVPGFSSVFSSRRCSLANIGYQGGSFLSPQQ
jgi:hypothetical protein